MRISDAIGMDVLRHPVVVDIQNVSDYVEAIGWANVKDDVLRLPIMPPWPHAIFEFSSGNGVDFGADVYVGKEQNWPDGERASLVTIVTYLDPMPESWGEPLRPLGESFFYLSHDGQIITGEPPDLLQDAGRTSSELGGVVHCLDVPGPLPGSMAERMTEILHVVTHRVYVACLFAHCRNVRTSDRVRPQTRQQRRHGPPAITYKVLEIGPMTRVLNEEGNAKANGPGKAFHICRAYFAHHKNLFGKHGPRTVLVPMHTRGKAKNGMVVKDYRVLPPHEELE